jgi:1,4-alpha-glucan branching enzyme
MKKWSIFLIAILALAMVAGCATSKKGGMMEKAAVGGEAPKVTAEGVEFAFEAPAGTQAVYLAGEFNGWRPDLDLMSDKDGDGIWTITYDLKPGTYQYKFVADGTWYHDANNPKTAPDGFGGNNSLLEVK